MNGKDLLAVLAMIVPGVLLTALIAFALVPASVMQPFPGGGEPRGKGPGARSGAENTQAMRVTLVQPEPGTATQKRMSDPWARPAYAKVP